MKVHNPGMSPASQDNQPPEFAARDQTVAHVELHRILDPLVEWQDRIGAHAQQVANQRPGAADGDRDLDRNLVERVVLRRGVERFFSHLRFSSCSVG